MSGRESQFWYGGKVDVLRWPVADESVDLACLDCSVSSNATYNLLFAEQDGATASAQIKSLKALGSGTTRRHGSTKRRWAS